MIANVPILGFNISIKYAVQILSAFIHPGQPMQVALYCTGLVFIDCSAVMYVNLFGNSTSWQTLYMLQGRDMLCFVTLALAYDRFEIGTIYQASSPNNVLGSDIWLCHWLCLQLH